VTAHFPPNIEHQAGMALHGASRHIRGVFEQMRRII
jgi:hypothetical protein